MPPQESQPSGGRVFDWGGIIFHSSGPLCVPPAPAGPSSHGLDGDEESSRSKRMDSCDLDDDHLITGYLTHGEVMGEPPVLLVLGWFIFSQDMGGSGSTEAHR